MGRQFTILYNRVRGSRKRPRRWMGRSPVVFFLLTRTHRYALSFRPGKGIHVWLRYPRNVSAEQLSRPDREWKTPEMKKKASAVAAGDANHRVPLESEFFRDLMSLVEHCALVKYDDGDPREPGWFTIKTQGAAWCVQVKDPDAAVSFTAVGATLDKALETAALLLGCDEAPWEPDTWLAAKKRPPKKK